MKKIYLLLAIAFMVCTLACSSNQSKANFTKGLEKQFTSQELDLLNEVALNFEEQLKELYNSNDVNPLYRRFVGELENLSISTTFYTNSKSKDILLRLQEFPSLNEKLQNTYLMAAAENASSEEFASLLEATYNAGDIPPDLAASGLNTFTDQQLYQDDVKLFAAIYLYYSWISYVQQSGSLPAEL